MESDTYAVRLIKSGLQVWVQSWNRGSWDLVLNSDTPSAAVYSKSAAEEVVNEIAEIVDIETEVVSI